MADLDLTQTHTGLTDTFAARRYFSKFDAISGHLVRVAAAMEHERSLSKLDVTILGEYLGAIGNTFAALANKYMMTGRDTGTFFGSLTIDRVESGFPTYQEILTMANDAQQAPNHLRNMPGVDDLKDDMVRTIVGDLAIPTRLQFALSQRLYYEALQDQDMFWAQNDPVAIWQKSTDDRKSYLVSWAVYDSQSNLPVIYMMDVEDTGKAALPKDSRRWPEVQRHLMAQAVGGLKLLTIAKGFDQDFDDLHPKRLRRFHIGPMYSSAFTEQSGPIRDVLAAAQSREGEDWALAWTVETLVSERIEMEKTGWFSKAERQIFKIDPFAIVADQGATSIERALILPERPYQALDELAPAGFSNIRKFVVSQGGRVLSYR